MLGDAALAPGTKRLESSDELSQDVAGESSAIGFIGFAYIGKARPVAISECKLSYAPSAFAVKTEEYPLARRLFLYTPEAHSAEVEDFLAYAGSDAAQRIVAQNGFVDLGIEPDGARTQAPRRIAALPALGRLQIVEQFLRVTEQATRLSVTFRFRPGSADLDNRAVFDLNRLAAFMSTPQWKQRKLLLMGFTDADGNYEGNLHLSRERAEAIRGMLAERGVTAVTAQGFGPEAPVACNDGDSGKNKNRHVEVWVQ